MMYFDLVMMKIAVMFFVIIAGWLARRRGYLDGDGTRQVGHFTADIIFPALVFTAMIRTVDLGAVGHDLFVVGCGAWIVALGFLCGGLTVFLWGKATHRPTFIFLSGLANWIFLPLPVIEALFGAPGVRVLLLFNFGAQLIFWTLGITLLRGGRFSRDSARNLLLNPGLLATIGGLVVALAWPEARALLAARPDQMRPWQWPIGVILQAVDMVGTLTIPMTMLMTGMQLGGLSLSGAKPTRDVVGVLAARLVLEPLAMVLLLNGAETVFGMRFDVVFRMTTYIVAAMPVAVSTSVVVERYGGDTRLTSLSIFYSTLASIVTVPAWCYLIDLAGW